MPPADGSSMAVHFSASQAIMDPKIAARSTSVHGRVCSPHISGGRRWLKLQAASVQAAAGRQLRHGTDTLLQNAA